MTKRTDRVRDGYEDATLIRLTGVGTCGGGGWERGVGIVCVSVLLINDVRSTFARLGVMIIRLFDLI